MTPWAASIILFQRLPAGQVLTNPARRLSSGCPNTDPPQGDVGGSNVSCDTIHDHNHTSVGDHHSTLGATGEVQTGAVARRRN